jgi:hypothetical protein
MHRRRFIREGLVTALSAVVARRGNGGQSVSSVSLIPSQSSQAPNYWCTWSAQNYMYGDDAAHIDPAVLEGSAGAILARDALDEERIFGQNGWAVKFFPDIRKDLYFLFDDGWETGGTASFMVDTQKFPSFAGSPEERLHKLDDAIRNQGWRGAAFWCRDPPGDGADLPLVMRTKLAGIHYWKVDGGDENFNVDQIRDEIDSHLITEHIYGEPPLNGDWHTSGRFEIQNWNSPRVEILRRANVYRTYDTVSILSVPTTLDRASQMLSAAQGHPEVHGLLNVEDEVYVAAVLGCTMGIMRYPLYGLRPDGDPDLSFAGSRNTKRRMDEVTRAIHWQRIAAPYSAGSGFVRLDPQILTDDWVFRSGETWDALTIGQLVKQGAPARISRNIELPRIEADKDKPYICVGRFPNDAVAIGSLERTSVRKEWFMPLVAASLKIPGTVGPVGIFGRFGAVNLMFDNSLRGARLLGQDLKGGAATDITKDVSIHGKELHIPGDLISAVGLQEATPGDLSSPGMVLTIV